ncbi:Protein of unknown function DUF2358 [Trinorchestia longiramus]|nr:Protein of unknown function DUF2358 [Trinorchestia longiramus]
MAFCLLRLKNSLINRASFAIYSSRLPTSSCFACQLELANEHRIAISRTSSTALHYKLCNDQLHPLTGCVNEHQIQANPVGVKGHKVSTAKVALSELFYRDPLAILLNSRLQIYEDVGTRARLLPEEAAGTRAGLEGSVKYHRHDLCSSVRLPHSPYCTEQHHNLSSLPSTSSSISCTSLMNPGAMNDLSSACVGSHLPGRYSGVVLSSPAEKTRDQCTPAKTPAGDAPHGLPSEDKLQHVHDVLVKSLSTFFLKPLDYSIYDKNIIFENRFRGTVTKGLSMYAVQMALLNTIGHLKHASIKFDIIKTTVHPEEATIKVRWRIKGIKPTKALYSFWVRKWRLTEIQQNDSWNWYDGFSTFHVNSTGLVAKHIADNMMPDDDKLRIRTKAGIFVKMATMLGLMPRPAAGHTSVMQDIPPLF